MSKYPGGYQIIDLGDLSKVTADPDTTLVISGIWQLIDESVKPIIITGAGQTSGDAGMTANSLSKARYLTDYDSDAHLFLIEYLDTTALDFPIREGISITTDDKIVDVILEP